MAELCRRRVPCVRAVGVPSRSKTGLYGRPRLAVYIGRAQYLLCARFERLPLGFSDFFFFFFVDVGNRTNVTSLIRFFVQEHILAKFGALRARSFNSRDRSL